MGFSLDIYQRLVKAGRAVRITLPDDSTVAGTITKVESVVVPGEGQDPDSTALDVTIAFAKGRAPAGLGAKEGTTVALLVLYVSVPVAALLAPLGGSRA